MLGFKFIKVEPTTYVMQYRGGRLIRQGAGLALAYFAPVTSVVAVPLASRTEPFMFQHTTRDFQAVTVQGQVAFRVARPAETAAALDFTLAADGRSYHAEDPQQLPARVVRAVEVLAQQFVQARELREALAATDALAEAVRAGLAGHAEIRALGLEIQGVEVVAVKPTPETARALEAEAREAILKGADDAIHARRHAAVEHERSIRESELETEIAVERKRRTVRETQMDAEAAVAARQQALAQGQLEADITLEETRKGLVARSADNTRVQAEAEAHRIEAVVGALKTADPRVVQALAAVGMQPAQLIAQAFGGIAERAERIGQLNMSPDLLQGLLGQAEGGRAERRHA